MRAKSDSADAGEGIGGKNARFIARLDSRCAFKIGKSATLWFSTDHPMLFEAATGETVLSSTRLRTLPG